MRLHIYKQKPLRIPRKQAESLFDAVSGEEAEPDQNGRVNLILTDDRSIRSLNKRFRGIDKPTDVLSFNIDEPVDHDSVFGEIYVSVDTAVRQAPEYGLSPGQEVLRLLCHGLLHLFGFDHEKSAEAGKMRAREQYYLEPFGIVEKK